MPHRSAEDVFLASLRGLVFGLVAEALATQPIARPFSQLDGERPSGVGRARYLRAWRRGHDAGDAECSADGRARTMSAGAWARHGASAPTSPRLREVTPIQDVDADACAAIGLDPQRRTG